MSAEATSTVPTSCLQTESTVLQGVAIEKAWQSFRHFQLDLLAPEYVKSCVCSVKVVDVAVVGSTVDITYTDGAVWKLHLTEVSDRHYTIAYTVITTEPKLTCTSIEGEIVLEKVTSSNETFLKWTTIFSNDADAQVMADTKYKKLDFFKAFAKSLTGK